MSAVLHIYATWAICTAGPLLLVLAPLAIKDRIDSIRRAR
jgi:hypothetical protein